MEQKYFDKNKLMKHMKPNLKSADISVLILSRNTGRTVYFNKLKERRGKKLWENQVSQEPLKPQTSLF